MPVPLRPELTPLPRHLRHRPVDARGYPVPWFVPIIDGQPEFRAADKAKLVEALRDRRCWVCGGPLGRYLAFVVGPMCAINRVSSEPPCHLDCAEWSARNCPFLTRPHMHRREDEVINAESVQAETAGIASLRNPGVALVWITETFQVFDDGRGKPLISLGDPSGVRWYAEGRAATRDEVDASIAAGLPGLRALAAQDPPGSVAILDRSLMALQPLLPA